MLRYTQNIASLSTGLRAARFDGIMSMLAELAVVGDSGLTFQVPDWLSLAVAGGRGEALTHLAGLHLAADRKGNGAAKAAALLRQAAEGGYLPAQERLGILWLFGIGGAADPVLAAEWMRLAAEGGSPEAQGLWGLMLATGCGCPSDMQAACHWLGVAGQKGVPHVEVCLQAADLGLLPQASHFFLGMWRVLATVMQSLPGDASEAELHLAIAQRAGGGDGGACLSIAVLKLAGGAGAEALHWCRLAAEAGEELAIIALGLLAFVDHADIRQTCPVEAWLQTTLAPLALGLMGVMRATGRVFDRDAEDAGRLLDQAAAAIAPATDLAKLLGTSEGRDVLEAIFYLWGKLLAQQIEGTDEPLSLIAKAMQLAEDGDGLAQFFVGMACRVGKEVATNPEESFRWMLKAAEQGVAAAQVSAAMAFKTGDGADRDPARARHWFRQAALQGNGEAQLFLALALLDGAAGEADALQGALWLRKAAETGHRHAQFTLAMRLLGGDHVKADPAEAIFWLQKAAESGDADYQYLLGSRYLSGHDVDEDSAKALVWLQKAAGQGHAKAKYMAGMLLLQREAPEDVRSGLHLLFEAAEQGEAQAIAFLASLK